MALTPFADYVSPKPVSFGSGANQSFQTLNPLSTSANATTYANQDHIRSLQNSLGYSAASGAGVSGLGSTAQSPNQTGFINPQTALRNSVQIGGTPAGVAAPYKPPTTTKIIPIRGLGSNTAGGGATFTDVNSGNPNYTPGDSAYAPTQQGTVDQNWMQQQLENDQQYKADLAQIAARGGNYLDQFTSAAQAAEIAAGFPFNPQTAAAAGYRFPSLTDPVTGNPISMGPLFQALSDPTIVQAAQSNPFSAEANILHDYNHLLNAQDAQMGAAGMGRSGDYMNAAGDYSGGYAHQQSQYARDKANYDAMQTFLGQLNTGYTNYQSQLDQLHADTVTARQNDLSKILSMINAGILNVPSALKNQPGGGDFGGVGFGASPGTYDTTPGGPLSATNRVGGIGSNSQIGAIASQYNLAGQHPSAYSPAPAPNLAAPPIGPSLINRFSRLVR